MWLSSHLIFYNSFARQSLLDGLGRHLQEIFGATPLYDFVTQLAGFDSPVATFLDREMRELKNYPMVCQSLQAVPAYLGFDWNAGAPYRRLYGTRSAPASIARSPSSMPTSPGT